MDIYEKQNCLTVRYRQWTINDAECIYGSLTPNRSKMLVWLRFINLLHLIDDHLHSLYSWVTTANIKMFSFYVLETYPVYVWVESWKQLWIPLQLLATKSLFSFLQIIKFYLLWKNYHFFIAGYALFLAIVTDVKEGFRHIDLFIGWVHKSMDEYKFY